MFRILPLVFALAACSSGASSPTTAATPGAEPSAATNPGPRESAELLHVLDGDSIEVALADGTRSEVRLIGINAPEAKECHGDAARAALHDLLDGAALSLVADADDTDQFGRLLRYVYAGNQSANMELVAAGHAVALQSGHSLEAEFAAVSDAAAAAGRGMFSPTACGSNEPAPPVRLVDYVFDPPGRDAEQANGEWVALRNDDPAPVAMAGWILRDESTQHRFTFPADFALGPGDSVTVRSGCGVQSNDQLFWCAPDPVWSNGGDTIILQSADGTIVIRERFAGDF